MAPRFPGRPRQGGFTYLGLIILVTVFGMVGAATLKIGALLQRAQAEEELLEIGAAFGAALQSYAAATPPGLPPQPPPSLKELLKDPRTPGLRRHLRKIFIDPLTGSTEWGIVYQADHVGVLAVYSLSQAKPLKIGNFDPRFHGFENKLHLSDWKFSSGLAPLAAPLLAARPPALPMAQAATAPIAPEPVLAPAPPPEPPPAEAEEEKIEEKPEPVTPPEPKEVKEER